VQETAKIMAEINPSEQAMRSQPVDILEFDIGSMGVTW
jgi:hypothetical protein